MDKIRISAVSYLNTKPFVYGIQHSGLMGQIDLSLDMPSLCATKLSDGRADIGLVPVAAIADVKDARIISDFCIASSGKVRTVVLVGNVPLTAIEKVVLDDQSRTSVQLVRVLAKYFWKISPIWEKGQPGFIDREMGQATAAVVIGDRAFEAAKRYKYCYDLGEAWKDHTGFDFVFACWVANKPLPIEFISEFNRALADGVLHIREVIDEYEKIYPDYGLNEYFYENLSLVLDEPKRKGLELFLKLNGTVDNITNRMV